MEPSPIQVKVEPPPAGLNVYDTGSFNQELWSNGQLDSKERADLIRRSVSHSLNIGLHEIIVVCVGGGNDGPPFAYTVGRWRQGLPELCVSGLAPGDGHRLITMMHEMGVDGEKVITVDSGYQVAFAAVFPDERSRLLLAMSDGAGLSAPVPLQVVCQDPERRWPWESEAGQVELVSNPRTVVNAGGAK